MIIQWLAISGTFILVLFFLGLCIFVHELGHLLVALWCGLHVERFSIGFGKKLWGFHYRGVEYIISMLPFGGYVALPQLDPTEEPHDSNGNPLPPGKPLDRMLTAASGPISNVLFGFLLGAVVWWIGVYRPAAMEEFVVHSVQPEAPEYEAGLRPGDRIVEINGKPAEEGWEKVAETIALSRGNVRLTVLRDSGRTTIQYRPAPNPEVENIGYPMFEVRTPVVVEWVQPGHPADAAGIQVGDTLLAVNGKPISHRFDFMQTIWNSGGEPVSITYSRGDETRTVEKLTPVSETVNETTTVHIIGVRVGEPQVLAHLSPWWQFKNVLKTTRNTLTSLVSSESLVKPQHMSGPIGIVQMNYMMIRYKGLRQGLFFVVFVSFSLALINLLPIPVLDGGHVLFALIEGVVRRPVPARIAYALQMMFAVLIISFMLYVTFFDIRRVGRHIFPGEDEAAPAPATEETE